MGFLTPIQVINSTTDQWRLDFLPTNLTVINGTLSNGTQINGHVYNGNASSIVNITVIERVQPSSFGSLTVVAFIYMLISFFIILFLASTFTKWVRVAFGQRQYNYTIFLPMTGSGALTFREFDRQLRRFYRRRTIDVSTPSYAETRPRHPSEDFSSQGLREFRELIRAKYAMDIQIWNYRHANVLSQPIVDEWRRRSRGATLEMMETVENWTESREKWSQEEWDKIQDISIRIRQLNEQEYVRYEALQHQ